MTDGSPLTVHCSVLAPFWNVVHVLSHGLHAVFTLGETLIIFGHTVVLDLFSHHHVTLTTTQPIAWPLRLKRPPAVTLPVLPPLA